MVKPLGLEAVVVGQCSGEEPEDQIFHCSDTKLSTPGRDQVFDAR